MNNYCAFLRSSISSLSHEVAALRKAVRALQCELVECELTDEVWQMRPNDDGITCESVVMSVLDLKGASGMTPWLIKAILFDPPRELLLEEKE